MVVGIFTDVCALVNEQHALVELTCESLSQYASSKPRTNHQVIKYHIDR
jgi:hypothetical protein